MQQQQTWYAHGKLLITGEYLVMSGARALALPVNKGQHLEITRTSVKKDARLLWTAKKPDGLWFRTEIELPTLQIIETTDKTLAEKLIEIFTVIRDFAPVFLDGRKSYKAETRLEFDTEFGFGSSSTLISNLAFWAGINPFDLQRKALGGSGYDVACARAEKPVFYQLINGKPVVESVVWSPPFKNRLYFVYLGQKQRSDESITQFKKSAVYNDSNIHNISAIGKKLVKTNNLKDFENLLCEHEEIMSAILGIAPVKERLFKGHPGIVKSLGAWGGDFVLITNHGTSKVFREQMKNMGFNTVFSWDELMLKK
jgi:mevalonate kinase